MEEFVFGVLLMLCISLIVASVVLLVSNKRKDEQFFEINELLDKILNLITNLPRNVIHLGLKEIDVETKISQLELPISPENFAVNVDKLKKLVLKKFETVEHPSPATRAYCILQESGFEILLSNHSFHNFKKGLARLLINEDLDEARKFLEILAESVCQGMIIPRETEEP